MMKVNAIFAVTAILLLAAEPNQVHFGPNGAFQPEYSKDSSGILAHGVIERLAGGATKSYPLPQSSVETYAKLRPADLKRNPIAATGNQYEREEVIGPYQVEGDKLWFGNNFYDGEGQRGVGTFGFFDAATRLYQLYSPPEVAPYEVSAILVEPNVVWLGLEHAGEDISTFPGGLVEWTRTTQAVRLYPIEFVVSKIARQDNTLRLITRNGYALLRNGVLSRFEVRTDATGKTETTSIARFPPPPSSHYRP
jgi:hypothetical protein